MSSRHFKSVIKRSEHLVSLQNLVFLIKDKITDTFRHTQFYIPHSRPIKAYLHGFDITRFLVHKTNLTNYSYYFLNYAATLKFSISDIRAYFKGFQAVTSRQPDVKRLMERGVKKPYQRTAQSTAAMSSAQMAEQSRQPFDDNTPGVKMYNKMLACPKAEINFTRKQTNAFKDTRVFRAAWKLACSRVTRFKTPETTMELKCFLTEQGLKQDALLCFKAYLLDVLPTSVTFEGLCNSLAEHASAMGWFPGGRKAMGETPLRQDFTQGDLRVCLQYPAHKDIRTADLAEIMFPNDWNDPVKKDY